MSDIICGRHQYNGVFIGEPCPICVMEEETNTTPQDKIEQLNERIAELEKDLIIADALPHPWYGPCDGFGDGGTCKECEEVRTHCIEQNYSHPGSIVTWAFYIDHPEGERRLRRYLDAPKVLRAVEDFERWLHCEVERTVPLPIWDVRDKLFKCFTDNDVIVPGWE